MTITPHQPLEAPIQGKPLYEEYRMDQVRVSDPYIANAFAKEVDYLTSYDPDRLLAGFRENRELPKRADKYPGWENTEIRGHTLGHYLSALSQAYACTRDDGLLLRLNYLLGELALCQHESGYLSAFEERLFDNVENKQPAWVPWYTMHKIIAGLTASYSATGSKTAYALADKLGDWVYRRTASWSEEVHQRVLSVEYGGMNDCLYDLYRITGKAGHLSAAHSFDELTLFTPVHEGKDILKGKHANTTIPKFLGALNRYRTLGESEVFIWKRRCSSGRWLSSITATSPEGTANGSTSVIRICWTGNAPTSQRRPATPTICSSLPASCSKSRENPVTPTSTRTPI